MNGRGEISGAHWESTFTDKNNYDKYGKVLRIDSTTPHITEPGVVETGYSLAGARNGNGTLRTPEELNFKKSYNGKTVISNTISESEIKKWGYEAADNLFYLNGNKAKGISDNNIVFEFWKPRNYGEPYKFYPTLETPPK